MDIYYSVWDCVKEKRTGFDLPIEHLSSAAAQLECDRMNEAFKTNNRDGKRYQVRAHSPAIKAAKRRHGA
jgi:hypothetical protein